MVLIPSIQDFPLEIEMTHYVPFKWSGKPPLPFIHMLSGLKLEEATRQNINYLEKCWTKPSRSPHGSLILLVHEIGQHVADGDWVMNAQSTRGKNWYPLHGVWFWSSLGISLV